MAQITINEISQSYSYNIGSNSYATVALPITASWGPGYSEGMTLDEVVWSRFPATQAGLEAFVRAYRSPTAGFRMVHDYSYQIATNLLTAGYDVLTCRLSKGTNAQIDGTGTITLVSKDIGSLLDSNGRAIQDNLNRDIQSQTDVETTLTIKAKYPGTFGNNLSVDVKFIVTNATTNFGYWNIVVNAKDSSGIITAVENLSFYLDVADALDGTIPHISEIESNFITIVATSGYDYMGRIMVDSDVVNAATFDLSGAEDFAIAATGSYSVTTAKEDALKFAAIRYGVDTTSETPITNPYYLALSNYLQADSETPTISDRDVFCTLYKQWLYTKTAGPASTSTNKDFSVYDALRDKLTYSPNRVISPAWDDQNLDEIGTKYGEYGGSYSDNPILVSPLAKRLLDTAALSRCATAYIDEPFSYPTTAIYSEDGDGGYVQQLAAYKASMNPLYPTNACISGPWRQYTLVGMNKAVFVSPSVLQLLIERAQILNDPIQYEWALPTNRTHTLNIGKPNHAVTQTMLDTWQNLSGVGVNILAEIPGLGVNIWGNSTLYNVPVATYQALANLSTRKLFNAVKDLVYRCGIAITFQYNNEQAYNKFYAGVTPLLDTMRNVGAIENYAVRMGADINGLDQVNANSVIGKIYLVVRGVINDITVDLIAMPAGTDLNQFAQ